MKATLLGIATGILWGLSAGLTKTVVEDLDEGVLSLLGDWHLYALAVVGWLSLTLAQASLQAGALAPAVATQAAVDPIASVLLGTLAFEETIHHGALGVAGSLAGFAAMVGGIVVLASSQASSLLVVGALCVCRGGIGVGEQRHRGVGPRQRGGSG